MNDGKISESMRDENDHGTVPVNIDLSQVRATTMRMDAFIKVSEMTILASQAYSPKGQGYCLHMRNNSEGIPRFAFAKSLKYSDI